MSTAYVDQIGVLLDAVTAPAGVFCRISTTCHALDPSCWQNAEHWNVNPIVNAKHQGDRFDTCYHDALRDARRALEQASAGRPSQHERYGAVAGRFRSILKFMQNLETHDEVGGAQPRIARLADRSDARSWYARSRSRVAASIC